MKNLFPKKSSRDGILISQKLVLKKVQSQRNPMLPIVSQLTILSGKGAFTYDVGCFEGIFDLPT